VTQTEGRIAVSMHAVDRASSSDAGPPLLLSAVLSTEHAVACGDDFTKATVERLAKRAGDLCSNPHCRVPTVGAAQGHDGVVNIGIAAHITAAAALALDYDATLSSDQRRDR
jgi:hypothetical protein